MTEGVKKYQLFTNGSKWLKADFHLHTKADKVFIHRDDADKFIASYVARLKDQHINIGVITNHNTFDKREFINVRKKAKQEEILMLAGVELSVNDGANGIHTLVVFSNQWLENNNDYISPFISSIFTGKTEHEYKNEHARSDKNILQVVDELEKINRDYFLVFAHVEQRSGLWEEMSGGKLTDFASKRYAMVRQRTLGFQKVRTHDTRTKVKRWLQGWYPAELEGSDCKRIDEIGSKKGETWLKIGAFTFEAVKYALADYQNRVRDKQPEAYQHSYIKSIAFDGGILGGKQIDFSPELNALIGIRGSGKSSILEAVRYVLNIPYSDKTTDQKYKTNLLAHTLASGGKAIIVAVDQHGQEYRLSRILNEHPEVFVDDELKPGIAIRKTIIHQPIYFGQKDLSSTGDGFEKDLVEKLVGEKLIDIQKQVEAQKAIVIGQCDKLMNIATVDEKIKEYTEKYQDAAFRLNIFKENGIEDKLKVQTDFNSDDRKLQAILTDIYDYEHALTEVVNQYEDTLINHLVYQSVQNKVFFKAFFDLFQVELNAFDTIKCELKKIRANVDLLEKKKTEFSALKKDQSDNFADIRRSLEADLKQQGKQLNLEEFPKLQKTIETAKRLLASLQKEREQHSTIKDTLLKALSKLNDLWHQEYKVIEVGLIKINQNDTALQISSTYKGDKGAFLSFFKSVYKGSRIRERNFQNIIEVYVDFVAIFNDFKNVKVQVGSSGEIFEQYFFENLKALLTYQVPNQFVIKYRGKALQHHSLGQRASALILFVLSQQENDLVIIDQPEDDLDNQTVYKDVITLVRKLKPQTQFIFATHNANFPVLGDSEQIHVCRYADESMQLSSGSIDSPLIQQEIVDIMEGGEDAFNKRKEIYQIWKPLNF